MYHNIILVILNMSCKKLKVKDEPKRKKHCFINGLKKKVRDPILSLKNDFHCIKLTNTDHIVGCVVLLFLFLSQPNCIKISRDVCQILRKKVFLLFHSMRHLLHFQIQTSLFFTVIFHRSF